MTEREQERQRIEEWAGQRMSAAAHVWLQDPEDTFSKRFIERDAVDPAIVRGVMARVPPSWDLKLGAEDGGMFLRGNIQVILSVSREDDHRIWIHASVCGSKRSGFFLPSWEDMKRVKHDFIGPDRWAYQVFPSEAKYINRNPCVLHLFALLEGEPALPDFTKGFPSL